MALNSIPCGKLAQQVSAQDTESSSSLCYWIRHRKRSKGFVVSCSTVLFFILITTVLPPTQPSTSFLNECKKEDCVTFRLDSVTSVPERVMEQVMLEATSQLFEEWENDWEQHRFTGTYYTWKIHYLLEWNECSVVEGIAVNVVYLDKASRMVSL